MKVKQLIEGLKKMPQESGVYYVWDGAARSGVDEVYLSRIDDVILIGMFETVSMDDDDLPKGYKGDTKGEV